MYRLFFFLLPVGSLVSYDYQKVLQIKETPFSEYSVSNDHLIIAQKNKQRSIHNIKIFNNSFKPVRDIDVLKMGIPEFSSYQLIDNDRLLIQNFLPVSDLTVDPITIIVLIDLNSKHIVKRKFQGIYPFFYDHSNKHIIGIHTLDKSDDYTDLSRVELFLFNKDLNYVATYQLKQMFSIRFLNSLEPETLFFNHKDFFILSRLQASANTVKNTNNLFFFKFDVSEYDLANYISLSQTINSILEMPEKKSFKVISDRFQIIDSNITSYKNMSFAFVSIRINMAVRLKKIRRKYINKQIFILCNFTEKRCKSYNRDIFFPGHVKIGIIKNTLIMKNYNSQLGIRNIFTININNIF